MRFTSVFTTMRRRTPPPKAPRPRLLQLQCHLAGCLCVRTLDMISFPSWHAALAVLGRFLTDEQIRQIHLSGYFVMISGKGNEYRIHTGTHSHNVTRIIKGVPAAKYCAVVSPAYAIPWPENLLCQAIALRTDEGRFLRTAHKQRL